MQVDFFFLAARFSHKNEVMPQLLSRFQHAGSIHAQVFDVLHHTQAKDSNLCLTTWNVYHSVNTRIEI